MEKENIIASISKKGNGQISLGVVGAVRTGKSTFIKRFIENMVVPNIEDEYEKKKCLDEVPQSAQGKIIMTTEPKFVPSSGATIKVDEFTTNIKLVDCVGYVINDSQGFLDEDGNPVELFPEVTFENSPKEVELKLVEEVVGVAESPLKTFPRVNEFETGASYRR